MRYSLAAALLLLIAFSGDVAATSEPADTPPATPPNIVIILADDMGWRDIGYHGSEIKTPHLDSLASEGVKLEQFYTSPLCSATRASLMTGRYAIRLGLQEGFLKPWSQHGLPPEERTLAQALREAGYATSMVGKWHLGMSAPDYLPQHRGFDHHYGSYGGSLNYFTHYYQKGLDWHRDGAALVEEGYATTLTGAEAARIIHDHDSARPLFLYAAFNAPHRPLQAPQEYETRYASISVEQRRTYAAMVSSLDDEVGRIVAALEEAGMRSNTLILFASDNGGSPLVGASNVPLRGRKGLVYEGGVRVSAFATWPGVLPAGIVVNEPLHIVDWYPTLLRIAGGSLEQPLALDGLDAWPTLANGAPSPHEEILVHLWPPGGALRRGDWKLVVTKRGKGEPQKVELFNLAEDPVEAHDLSAEHPERTKKLLARLEIYRRQSVPMKKSPSKMPRGFRVPKVWGEFDVVAPKH